ncbi:uncharacterized protein LOC110974403 [Acanthaster planci]|uniref:Iodothyronine deiodinase n=1 Tax=Acanthaster planci TaxID=133434 RepID=A0A8B7XLL1_ACAPL|nr:uncharacterized protein LOC110974403 [Acanthaster planci]
MQNAIDDELLSDRAMVQRVLRKQREVLEGERGKQAFAEINDPTQPNLLRRIKRAQHKADRIALEELGLDKHVKDWSKFTGLLMPIMAKYKSDQEACVLGGTLAQLFHEYKDRADFLCIYLAEAHPAEYFNLNTTFKVPQHQTKEDRVAAAYKLLEEDREHHHTFTDDPLDCSLIRIVTDTMTNDFAQVYNAHPDRVFIFQGDIVIYVGDTIGKQMMNPDVLMTEATRNWLENYFKDTVD